MDMQLLTVRMTTLPCYLPVVGLHDTGAHPWHRA